MRPWALWALIPWGILAVLLRRQGSATEQWGKFIAPHLLKRLIVGRSEWRLLTPGVLVFLLLFLSIAALSGPTWQREKPPFSEDKAPLVICLDLSSSMEAIDLQPSRLERAKQKIKDLLALRKGARTALIAYAGSAHTVLPPTDDPDLVASYLDALAPDLMPLSGKDPDAALKLAGEMLARDETPGTILIVADGLPIREYRRQDKQQLIALGVGTSRGGPIPGGKGVAQFDWHSFEEFHDKAGAVVTSVTLDNSDVRRIQSNVQTHLQDVLNRDQRLRWIDSGYWLTLPVVLLASLWFRRGFVVQWFGILIVLMGGSAAYGAEKQEPLWMRLFLTSDQQGRYYYERGDYADAARCFEDAEWKGVAFYRAGDFESAAAWFSQVKGASGAYNHGNALARLNKLGEAVASYDKALGINPALADAKTNRDLLQAILDRRKKNDQGEREEHPPDMKADQMKFDKKGDSGKKTKVEMEKITDKDLAKVWLRRLEVSPAGFLRNKFEIQEEETKRRGGGR
ncbi:MAG: VWA domain-containing protein [Acidobacteria bacterium]|nr:VWA domain-containing protein [Acidobacteriota bacterium]